ERALTLTDEAMKYKNARRTVDPHVWGEILANRAWALALLNRCEEAKTQIDEALKAIPENYKPTVGGQYYRAGQTMRACGDFNAARDFFKRSVEADPGGAYTESSKRALEQFSS